MHVSVSKRAFAALTTSSVIFCHDFGVDLVPSVFLSVTQAADTVGQFISHQCFRLKNPLQTCFSKRIVA